MGQTQTRSLIASDAVRVLRTYDVDVPDGMDDRFLEDLAGVLVGMGRAMAEAQDKADEVQWKVEDTEREYANLVDEVYEQYRELDDAYSRLRSLHDGMELDDDMDDEMAGLLEKMRNVTDELDDMARRHGTDR